MVKVVITGGLGFLGRQICRHLLRQGTVFSPVSGAMAPISRVTLFDMENPEIVQQASSQQSAGVRAAGEDLTMLVDERVDIVGGNMTDAGTVAGLVDTDDIAVFHLASMMSGNSEDAFDDAWAVNVEGQRTLLEALRARASAPRFMFSSSVVRFAARHAACHDGVDVCVCVCKVCVCGRGRRLVWLLVGLGWGRMHARVGGGAAEAAAGSRWWWRGVVSLRL